MGKAATRGFGDFDFPLEKGFVFKAELIPNAEIRPGSYLAEMLLERQALTF